MTTDRPPPPAASRAGVLALNAGSSSLKFAVFAADETARPRVSGQVERIGGTESKLHFRVPDGASGSEPFDSRNPREAAHQLLDWLARREEFEGIGAVSHRLVHGGLKFTAPQRVTPELLAALEELRPLDPEHLPAEIAIIRAVLERFPAWPQVACFDTAFHAHLPRVARMLPIPRSWEAHGARRYGFHGLSYTFLMEELRRLDGDAAARGRVILAHLGSGASMAAVKDGVGIDTSMGFTPAAGLPMSTRSGDLDPGVFAFLARQGSLRAEQIDHLLNHESGLLGVSGISGDIRDLLAREETEPAAAEAVAFFCYQARKWIGSFAAALGGLDTLVFAGGIGEHSASVRGRICEGLEFLGLHLDSAANAAHAPRISAAGSRVSVRVIPTDEEIVLARSAFRLLAAQSP